MTKTRISKILRKHYGHTNGHAVKELNELVDGEKKRVLGEVFEAGYDPMSKTYSPDVIFDDLRETLKKLNSKKQHE